MSLTLSFHTAAQDSQPFSAGSPLRWRVVVSAEVLKSKGIETGHPIKISAVDSSKVDSDPKEGTDTWIVGTAWPSFSSETQKVSVPAALETCLKVKAGSKVEATGLAVEALKCNTVRASITSITPLASTAASTSKSSTTDALSALSKLAEGERNLLQIYLKEILVELSYTRSLQVIEIVFQGMRYRIVLYSSESAGAEAVLAISRSTRVRLSRKIRSVEHKQDSRSSKNVGEPERDDSWAYASLGGLEKQIEEVRALVEMPLKRPWVFAQYGLKPPRGLLLFGPPGTGKTSLARAAARAAGCAVFSINGPELSSAYHGETERALRSVFTAARKASPAVVLIDEVDALAPRRDAGGGGGGDAGGAGGDGAGEVEKRVVATLLTLLDGIEEGELIKNAAGDSDSDDEESLELHNSRTDSRNSANRPRIVVIAVTNRPNAIDPALRRPGRLDREIEVGIPQAPARLSILRLLLQRVPHVLSDSEVQQLAQSTHGFVGADLGALVREAGMRAVKRTLGENPPVKREPADEQSLRLQMEQLALADQTKAPADVTISPVQYSDFLAAQTLVRPSTMREIFLDTPSVRWADIAASGDVHARVREVVEWPLLHSGTFVRLGVTPPRGALLYGPPGCSKTLIARALATETGLNFIAVKGPELFSKYVGDSERAVREVFRKARSAAPSIVFFDELDALATTRGEADGSGLGDRLIASLLNEMDGIEALANVIVVGATNRPEIIDPALLRPGRLDRLLYVGPPDRPARKRIFQMRTQKMAVDDDVDADALAAITEGCSGAEVVSICQDAGMIAMNEDLSIARIRQHHFMQAARAVRRRITPQMIAGYEKWRDQTGL